MAKKIPKATYSGILKIGESEIPCYVLENGERILSTSGMMKSLGRSRYGKKPERSDLPVFLEAKNIEPYVYKELKEGAKTLIFRTDKGQRITGYKAEILPTICEIYLKARDENVLQANQLPIAKKCEILVRGFARVGIIALIDEATGYQVYRSRKALEELLDKYISKELIDWAKTFPDEFYLEMFRLRGWNYYPFIVPKKRPGVVGHYTNDLVYERIGPDVLKELRKNNPKDSKGRRRHKLFQWLTDDVGHPKLKEHLVGVITLMKAATKWDQFYRSMQRVFPKYGDTLILPIPDGEE